MWYHWGLEFLVLSIKQFPHLDPPAWPQQSPDKLHTDNSGWWRCEIILTRLVSPESPCFFFSPFIIWSYYLFSSSCRIGSYDSQQHSTFLIADLPFQSFHSILLASFLPSFCFTQQSQSLVMLLVVHWNCCINNDPSFPCPPPPPCGISLRSRFHPLTPSPPPYFHSWPWCCSLLSSPPFAASKSKRDFCLIRGVSLTKIWMNSAVLSAGFRHKVDSSVVSFLKKLIHTENRNPLAGCMVLYPKDLMVS